MSFPADLFTLLDAQVAQRLHAHGYELARSERSGPFGSHYTEYRGPASIVALVWDGKEGWLTLGQQPRNPVAAVSSDKELFFERFPGLAVPLPKYEQAVSRLLQALEDHLSNAS
jgi:hypothetical protein